MAAGRRHARLPSTMMFRKPLTLKTSSAVRNSDKRKLRQRIASTFACSTEDTDTLVNAFLTTSSLPTFVPITMLLVSYISMPTGLLCGTALGDPPTS